MKKRGQTVLRPKVGQTIVEYILLLALVAGVVMVLKRAMEGPMSEIVASSTEQLRTEASRGGKEALEQYYVGGKGEIITKDR